MTRPCFAAAIGERLRAGLAPEVDLVDARAGGGTRRPDLLLVECHEGGAPPGMDALLEQARLLGIPSVLWDTLDRVPGQAVRSIAARFDFVWCADPDAAQALRDAGIGAEWLPPAIQPRAHNPFRPFDEAGGSAMGVLWDGPAGVESPEWLAGARHFGLRRLDGVSAQERLRAIKRSRVRLCAGAGPGTRAARQWEALEAAACRVPVVHLGRLDEDDPRKGIAIEAADAAAALAVLEHFAVDELARRRLAQKGWREAHLRHAFAERVRTIGARAGVPTAPAAPARASAVMPTRRVELLRRCVETFDRQTWPAKDLVIVVNRDSLDGAGDVVAAIRARADAQIVNVPEECYAGACLNVGNAMARGDWCFRMDDDDYYGENYLMDMMLHLRCVDADIAGKPPRYFYFEPEDRTYERNVPTPELTLLPPQACAGGAHWLGGNTLGVRKAAAGARYPDLVFAAADTVFLMRAAGAGLAIASLDELNVVASRRADASGHTWNVDVAELKRNSVERCAGFEELMV